MKISELRYFYYLTDVIPKWAEDDTTVLEVIDELRLLTSFTEDTSKKHIMEFLTGDISLGAAIKARYNWCVKAVELHPQVGMYKTQNGPVFAVFESKKNIHSFKIGCTPIESLYCTSDLCRPVHAITRKLVTSWLAQCGLHKEITIGFLLSEYRKRFSK